MPTGLASVHLGTAPAMLHYTKAMTPPQSSRAAPLIALATATGLFLAVVSVAAASAGPDRGAAVPSFKATDQDGNSQNFDSLTGENGLLLLFFRSADW